MNHEENLEQRNYESGEQAEYEAPKIESAITPEDLAREVAYAGITDNTPIVG